MKTIANHCSDEQLLAFLDGELNPEVTSTVREHLSRCWECRSRMGDIESRARQLVRLIGDASFLGADRVQAARERFLNSVQQSTSAASVPTVTSRREARVVPFLPPPSNTSRLATFALAVGLVASVLILWFSLPAPTADLASKVSDAVTIEADSLRMPLHQQLRVQLLEYRPRQTKRNSKLEIWSDARARRFAAKWSPEHGPLEYAVWQPEADRRFRYDARMKQALALPSGAQQAEQTVTAALSSAGDFASVEKRFATWIATRRWQPLTMAKDFSLFVSTEGVLLRSETRRDRQQVLTVMTATSTRGDSSVTMTLELDAATHVARAQEIRFSSARRDIAVRLIADRNERLAATPASVNFFRPDVPQGPIPSFAASTSVAPPRQTLLPSSSELLNIQASAEYELHRIRACVNDSIFVTNDRRSGVRVSGVVDSIQRKDEILQALSRIGSQRWMTVDVKTLDEAASAEKPLPSTMLQQVVPSAPSPVKVAVESLPLDRTLLTYFETHPLPASLPLLGNSTGGEAKAPLSAKARTAAYSSAIVSLSQASYRESWAIRRLAETFASPEMLSAVSARLLESMLRDHSRELGQTSNSLDNALRPIFAIGPIENGIVAEGATARPVWPATAQAIFQKAERTNKTLFELFATGAVTSTQGTGVEARGAVEQVLSDLPALTSIARQAEAFEFEPAREKLAGHGATDNPELNSVKGPRR